MNNKVIQKIYLEKRCNKIFKNIINSIKLLFISNCLLMHYYIRQKKNIYLNIHITETLNIILNLSW